MHTKKPLLSVLVVILFVLSLPVAVNALDDPTGGEDVSDNPEGPVGGGDPGPSGGQCPDPWPVVVTVVSPGDQALRLVPVSTATYRSVDQDIDGKFKAVICPEDTIAWEPNSASTPGLRVENSHSTSIRIQWEYLGPSYSNEIVLAPGESVFHDFASGMRGVDILDPPLSDGSGSKGGTI